MQKDTKTNRLKHTQSQISDFEMLGKVPPQAIELEEAVLGAIMLESTSIDLVISVLSPEAFYKEANKKIYEAILILNKAHNPIDIYTVVQELKKQNNLENVGGAQFVSGLTMKVGSAANIEYHAKIIAQKYIQREIIRTSSEMQQRAFDDNADVSDLITDAERDLSGLSQQVALGAKSSHISEAANTSYDEAEKRVNNARKGVKNGIHTGLVDLDKFTNGWQPANLIVLAARPSMGKALKIDELILTPSGWVKNKDLKVGDEVCSIDGNKSFVKGIFPQGELEMYEVEFSDGRKIECCENHLWEVNSSKFNGNNTRVLSTKDLVSKLNCVRYKRRISIPMFSGVFGSKKEFLIHPYLIGVLIGDGCLTRGVVWSKPDNFIVEKIKGFGYDIKSFKDNSHRIIDNSKGLKNKYLDELRKLNLYGKHSYERFIPDEYKNTCREQRLELLNGILDTDGDVQPCGDICYNTTSYQLALDVQQLCFSLGYKCSLKKRKSFLYGVQKRDSYRLYISSNNESELFTLPKKKERTKVREINPLTIVSINKINKKEHCQCISVTHERELYITKDYLVTHNTSVLLHFALTAAKQNIDTVIFSIEMPAVGLTNRLIISESGVDPDRFRSGYMTDDELNKVANATSLVSKLPIHIIDNADANMSQIRARSRLLQKQGKCKFILIDYLQRIKGRNNDSWSKNQIVGEMIIEAKSMAKELNIPVIMLSQLNRGVEGRAERKPMLSDLRESGDIEQEADIVMFIYRPEYYGTKVQDEFGNIEENYGELIIAKGRDGAIGTVKFKHSKGLMNIYDYNKQIEPPQNNSYYEPFGKQIEPNVEF